VEEARQSFERAMQAEADSSRVQEGLTDMLEVFDPKTGQIESVRPFTSDERHMPGFIRSTENNYQGTKWSTRRVPMVSTSDNNSYLSLETDEEKNEALYAYAQYSTLPDVFFDEQEKEMITAIFNYESVSDRKLDELIETTRLTFDEGDQVGSPLLKELEKARSASSQPSMLRTLAKFNPARVSVFKDLKARTNAHVAEKELAAEIAQGRDQKKIFMGTDYNRSSLRILASDARVRAMCKEIEYIYGEDSNFANALDSAEPGTKISKMHEKVLRELARNTAATEGLNNIWIGKTSQV
jgi:hypothetical protein